MPAYLGFCGPSNPSQSLQADAERLVNWYVESVQSQAAPTGAALYPTPGQQPFVTTPDVGTRGGISIGGWTLVVIGTGLYELTQTQTYTKRGTVAQDNYPATLSYNGSATSQFFVTSGGNGYLYNPTTHVLTQVLTGDATMGGMLNGRFLAFNILTGRVRMSAQNDGLTWSGALFFERSLAPDPWQAMVINPPVIWLIGSQTGEVWYDSGAFPQPFAPYGGAFFQSGTAAPFSVAVAGDYVTWLNATEGGAGTIVAARGYTPQAISNFAVETAISGYRRTASITDAEVLVYEQDGHLFGIFSFQSARGTWAYDFTTGAWGERGSWNPATNRFDAWRPRVHLDAFNRHLVGERATGTISTLDVTYGLDGTAPIRRLRIGPPLYAASAQRLEVSRFEVLVETGLGLPIGQGSDPKMMLRTSPNAKTWSSQRMASAGKMGDHDRRCVWTRCGGSDKLWVPELTVSDPIPWRISGASLEGSGFQQQQKAAA